ncbi:Lrp/AsnC family transcriptional regulator [Kineococcus sp. R86509]|uniref:Lrp/AsnC family transcriptional regulator n=1 Tax=Kineococcus sp. R86509 TaxID=3093851 RepID=UPI0036D2B51A
MILDRFEPLDQQLLQALQLDGRASFRLLGQVLGVSDQTVARRYAKLRSAGRARVLGLTDPLRLGEVSWVLRIRTTPDAALPVAQALARREDTSWIHLTSGGTEIVCSARSPLVQDDDSLLLAKLPRTQRIVDLSAQQVLHVFHGLAESPLLKSGILGPDQVAALTAGVPLVEPRDSPVVTDEVDAAVLDVLAIDGRVPVEELGARTGVPTSTVRRRMDALRRAGVLYYDVDFDPRRRDTGYPTMVWLSIAPADLPAAGEQLAALPESAFVAATTGRTNLYASLLSSGSTEVYQLISGPLAALPGVRDIESAPVLRAVKAAGSLTGRP